MTELLNQWLNLQSRDDLIMRAARARNWSLDMLLTNVAADSLLGLAYCALSTALIYLIVRSDDMRFRPLYLLISVFFLVCATMHFISIWSLWQPVDWAAAMVKAGAALVSVITVVALWPIVPRVVQMPSRKRMAEIIRRLEKEVAERRHAEEALRKSQATLRELAAYQEQIREDERKRIAREIHDDLGQNLLALRLDVAILHARTSGRHFNLNEKIVAALGHIDTTMKSVRAIINNLRPPVLDLGLQAAIEWQVKEFTRVSGIASRLDVDDQCDKLEETQAIAIFRVLQESLTNVRRHACASSVDIELRCVGGWLSMFVNDNGVGMHPNDRRKAHRFGLVGMAERIAMLGGDLRIESVPGRGTELRLSIPMHTPHEAREVEGGMLQPIQES